jgi:hypothetical protein
VTCQSYPRLSEDARTFEELFGSYLLQESSILEVFPETYHIKTHEPNLYAAMLFQRAKAISNKFPGVDLWDCLEPALRHTMKRYILKNGPFDKFFERNLREHLLKATARNTEMAVLRARRERRYAKEARRRRSEHDDQAEIYKRWSRYLLDAVTLRLDFQTRVYIEMRRDGAAVGDIAEALNVSEESLGNKYGGKKLVKRVLREIRKMALDLTAHQRGLLIRHLLDEAGLTIGQVERLLGGPVEVVTGVPVLEEEAILGSLGWMENFQKNNWWISANPAFVGEDVCRHFPCGSSCNREYSSPASA